MIKAYIFDMDGTLIDSMPMWNSINAEVLAELSGIELDEETARELGPLSILDTSAYMIERFHIPMTAQKLRNVFLEHLHAKYQTVVRPKDGAVEFLEQCRARGIPMCVATATETPIAMEAMQAQGLAPYMEFLISCDDVGKSKCEPDVYLEAARRLGLSPEEICVIEDVYYGAATAKRAGFSVIAVYDSMVSEDETAALKQLCDRYIGSFRELLEE